MNRELRVMVFMAFLACCEVEAATRVVYFGDSCGSTTDAYVNTGVLKTVVNSMLALNPRPQAAFFGGDAIYSPVNVDGSYLQFTNCIRPLLAAGIPLYPAIGNHEYSTAVNWYGMYRSAFPSLPTNGLANWSRLAYYVDVGDVRVVAVDSVTGGTSWNGSVTYKVDGTQLDWFRSVIGSNSPAAFDITFSHMPAYPVTVVHEADCLSYWPGERDAFLKNMSDARVSAYLSGHEHLYARRMVDARYDVDLSCMVPHVTSIAGAPFHSALNGNTPQPEATDTSRYSFVVFDLDAGTGRGTVTVCKYDDLTVMEQFEVLSKSIGVTVELASSFVHESAGTLASHGTVVLRGIAASNTLVSLISSDTSKVTVPASVIVQAGYSSVEFDITVVRDAGYDCRKTVTITASMSGFPDGAAEIHVLDVGGGDAVLAIKGDTWRYADNGVDLGTAWRNASFDDSDWASGVAKFGYGDGNEVTLVGWGEDPTNRFITTYFRHGFTWPNPTGPTNLIIDILRDDGAVIYVNGSEALRDNMPPSGTILYSTLATSSVGGVNEEIFYRHVRQTASLTGGASVVGVEVHQSGPGSSDLGFDISVSVRMCPQAWLGNQPRAARFAQTYNNVALDGYYQENFSGCALNRAGNELLVVLNSPPTAESIQIYDLAGNYLRRVTLTGFRDTESICQYDPARNLYAIVEEDTNDITIVEIDAGTTTIAKQNCKTISMDQTFATFNNGIEGITYDQLNDCFYAVKEKFPMAVYVIDPKATGNVVRTLFDAEAVFAGVASDLSDLIYDPYSGHLFIMSQESNRVFECDFSGNILSSVAVPATQPEGITLSPEGDTMYIIGEPNEYYVYSLGKAGGSGPETVNVADIPVTLSAPYATNMSIGYLITSQVATVGLDYSPAGGYLQFAPGQVCGTVQVSIVSDSVYEGNETLNISLVGNPDIMLAHDREYGYTIMADKIPLTVYSPWGAPVPSVGVALLEYGTNTVCSVAGSPVTAGTTQYLCRGWTGSGSVPASGTTTSTSPFTLTNASSISWLWHTNYWLNTGTNGAGTVSVADSWHRAGSNVVIVASNSAHYTFSAWTGDTNGCSIAGASITAPMTGPRTITALFQVDMHKLVVASAYGGAVPPTGTNTYGYGSGVSCRITNSPLFDSDIPTQVVCIGWSGTGSAGSGSGTNTTIVLTNDSSITWNWDGSAAALTLTFTNGTVREGAGSVAGLGRVSAPGAVKSDLVVAMLSGNTGELTVPPTVTIPAGSASASFTVTVKDDVVCDGTVTVVVSVASSGYVGGNALLAVADNDVHHLSFGSIASTQSEGAPFEVNVSARDINGVLVPDWNYPGVTMTGSGAGGTSTVTPASISFTNGQWNGNVTVAAADTGVKLVANDGAGHAGTSTAFNVLSVTLDHFNWSIVPSPQGIGYPFNVTITARSSNELGVVGFTNTVDIGASIVFSNQTVGTGTSSDSLYVLGTFRADMRDQVIYRKEDLGGSFAITSLAVQVTAVPPGAMNGWTIRMKHTALNSYSSPSWETAGWVTVYTANETISSTGWHTFVFSTPFEYNNASNLMVDYTFNNSVGLVGNGSCMYSAAGAGDNRAVRNRVNNTYGDPLTWAGDTPTPRPSTQYPNIRLNGVRNMPLSVSTSGVFVGGMWTGQLAVLDGGSNITLVADDNSGHTGISAAFNALRMWSVAVNSAHGNANPPVGTTNYLNGVSLACGITNATVSNGAGTQYVCTGWAGAGSVQPSGVGTNTGIFTVTTNSTVTWLWGTNYWLAAATFGSGTVGGANMWVAADSNASPNAVPASYNHLRFWSGDVGAGDTNAATLLLTMDRARAVAAHFGQNLATNSTPEWWLAQYYGATDFNAAAMADTDADFMPAWQEYRAGLNPTDAASVLKILSAAPGTTNVSVWWRSVTGKYYSVLATTNILSGWAGARVIVSNQAGLAGGSNIVYDIIPANGKNYYRVNLAQ